MGIFGGKSGGTTVAQPQESEYSKQLAAMSKDLYEKTDPLRTTYIDQWLNFLTPTKTLKPGAVPTYAPAATSTTGGATTVGAPTGYTDPSTGILYGAYPAGLTYHEGTTKPYGLSALGGKGDETKTSPGYYTIQLEDGRIVAVDPVGGTSGAGKTGTGTTGQGQPIYQESDYITQQYNPANLPGYTPQYDISRQGLEAQYNTAMGNAIATTPRGGAMSDALNKLNLARAQSVGGLPAQISSTLISDMLNKSYGAAFNTPTQSISGLSSANQAYTTTQNAMIQAQTAANAQSAQSKGSLGAGLGTVIGSALGSLI